MQVTIQIIETSWKQHLHFTEAWSKLCKLLLCWQGTRFRHAANGPTHCSKCIFKMVICQLGQNQHTQYYQNKYMLARWHQKGNQVVGLHAANRRPRSTPEILRPASCPLAMFQGLRGYLNYRSVMSVFTFNIAMESNYEHQQISSHGQKMLQP